MEFVEFLELEEFKSILEIVNEDRSSGERPYSFLYRVNSKHRILTKKERVETEVLILAMLYNSEQLTRLEKNKNNAEEEKIKTKELKSEIAKIDFESFNYNLFQNSSILL
jgi:hypothetical protein